MPLEVPFIVGPSCINSNNGGVKSYFMNRPHYSVKAEKISYFNDDTGVYFTFHLPPGYLNNNSGNNTCLLCSIPVGRTKAFILEAMEELMSICAQFRVRVYDPCSNGPLSVDMEALRDTWESMNNTLCTIIKANHYTAQYWTIPGQTLELCWQWNYRLKRNEKDYGLPCPKIYYKPTESTNTTATFVGWKITAPTLLPAFVDYVVIAVDGFDHKTVILFEVEMEKLKPLLWEFTEGEEEKTGMIKITYPAISDSLMQFVLSQQIIRENYRSVKEEQLLEEEEL